LEAGWQWEVAARHWRLHRERLGQLPGSVLESSRIFYITTTPELTLRLYQSGPKSGGSGPYKAGWTYDPTLPNQTVYAPKSPPQNLSIPVIAWGESGCANSGTRFAEFLTEIASYGYLVLASGPPPGKPSGSGQTKLAQMVESINWADKGNGAAYGNVDKTKIIAAGQSCGGLEVSR
jgi:hypothetical protein